MRGRNPQFSSGEKMKVGDKVKIKEGKHTGKIGLIKTAKITNGFECFDVEIPKADRWHFFMANEIEVVPPSPSPAEDVNRMVRVAAQRVVDCWRRGMQPPIVENAIQYLEKALLN